MIAIDWLSYALGGLSVLGAWFAGTVLIAAVRALIGHQTPVIK